MINKSDLLNGVANYFSAKVQRGVGVYSTVRSAFFSSKNQETCIVSMAMPVCGVNVDDLKATVLKTTEVEDVTVKLYPEHVEFHLKNAYSLYLRQLSSHFGIPYHQEKNRLLFCLLVTCLLALLARLIT